MTDELPEDIVREFMAEFEPEELHADLAVYLEPAIYGKNLRHPLVYCVPYFEQSNRQLNKMLAHKKVRLEQAVAEQDWHSFIFLHERPYRVDALEAVMFEHEIEDPAIVWSLVTSVWIDSENIYQNFDRWRDIWERGPARRAVKCMEQNERLALNAMPKTFTIYRGVGHVEASRGMSWTTDRERAIWFARRFAADDKRTPLLITANVRRIDVLAHYLGRNESEIVVLPEHVEIVTVDDAKKIS